MGTMFDGNVPYSHWDGTDAETVLLGFILDNTRLENDGILLPSEVYTNLREYYSELPKTCKAEFSCMLERAIDMAYGSVLDTGIVQRVLTQMSDTLEITTAYCGLQFYQLEDD